MRFSGMAEALEAVLMDSNSDLIPFREKIRKFVDAEWELRYNKKLNRFIKKATLKYPGADFDNTIYEPSRMLDSHIIEELAKCDWVDKGRNLIITGKTSSDKSYLANALCICALRSFRTVRYIKASQLINELSNAEKLYNYQGLLNQMASYDLLAVDDFGLKKGFRL